MEQVLILTILGLFVLLGMIYSVVVPPLEASDEKWHYPMVKYIADNWSLPVQEPGVETPWRQEGSQAPLYYAVAAVATFWIDTSDMEVVRHLNPHVDAGATADGNVNLVVHNPALEGFPWQGTVLAVHLIRFISVLMSTAAVYLTYLIVRDILPDQPLISLGAAAIHAFTPMYVFIAASVNNDNLVIPLSSLALLMLLRLAWQRVWTPKEALRRYLLLGVALGLAAMAKSNALPLTVLTALVVAVRAVRRRSGSEFLIGGAATLGPFLAIAGWWFLRNLRLYGDLTGLNAFIDILGQRDVPADLAQLWRERFSFLAGYWGNFGGLNVPMAAWTYTALNSILVIAGMGLVVALVRSRISNPKSPSVEDRDSAFRRLPFVICLLWALAVFVQWLGWARVTWSSQGRLVSYAIPAWSLLLGLGVAGWVPSRHRRWAAVALGSFLLILAVAAPWLWIRPAYAPPRPLTDAQVAAIPHSLESSFGQLMRLLGYELETDSVEPGGQVAVTLYWEALAPADRNYTVFVHLLGEEELLVAQRDTFPGLGLLSTTWLEPGYRWADPYVLQVPETAYSPNLAQIEVGVYDAIGQERLTVSSGSDHVRFGQVEIRTRPGDIPNPTSVNFRDEMELVGYDLSQRVARPGGEITLTLYWRGLQRMEANYTVSSQFVDREQRKAAQNDAWPLDGAAPTAAWEPGDIICDPLTMTVFPEAQPGAYDVQVVVYTSIEGKIVHLPVISASGEMLAKRVLLTKVRVTP